jgi:hypothetical protein
VDNLLITDNSDSSGLERESPHIPTQLENIIEEPEGCYSPMMEK